MAHFNLFAMLCIYVLKFPSGVSVVQCGAAALIEARGLKNRLIVARNQKICITHHRETVSLHLQKPVCFYVARDLTQTTYPPSRNRIIAGYNESAVWARQHAAMWDGRASAAKRDGAASAYPLGAHGAVVLPLVSRPFAESTSFPVAV